MNYLEQRVLDCKKNRNGRKTAVWGAGNNLSFVRDLLGREGMKADLIVDSDLTKTDQVQIFSPDILNQRKEEYYVIVSCRADTESIEKKLMGWGFLSFYDYSSRMNGAYFGYDILRENYSDNMGNRIFGKMENTYVSFTGSNAKIYAEGNVVDFGSRISMGDNAVLILGENVRLWGRFLNVGMFLHVGTAARCKIGCGTTFGGDGQIVVETGTFFECGADCMVSSQVHIRSGDGHPMFDLTTGKCTNQTIGCVQGIRIGNHVWVGESAFLLERTEIGSGSIVGAAALVKGIFPNNCSLGGNPAKVLRRDVAWNRWPADDIGGMPEEYCQMTKNETS